MIKKLLLLILFLLPIALKAQIAVGDWKIHSIFGSEITDIIDTKDHVYYLASNNLFCYDKTTQESIGYTKRNKLSDILVKSIHYNYTKKYLLVVYNNSNIDFFYDNGDIINLPDIKDVILASSKTINGVAFKDDRVYVATDFGYVILNDVKHEVAESRLFYSPITAVSVVGERLVLANGAKLFWGDLSKRYNALSDFNSFATTGINKIVAVNDKDFMFYTGWCFSGSFSDTGELSTATLYGGASKSMQPAGNNFLLQCTNGELRIYDNKIALLSTINLNAELQKTIISSNEGNTKFWALGTAGIKNIELAQNGTETVLSDYFHPNASTVSNAYNMVFNDALNKLYVMNIGSNEYVYDYNTPATVNTLEGATWSDITPLNVPARANDGILRDPYQPIIDPVDPSIYYIGSWYSGAYRMQGDKCLSVYNTTNSPMDKQWYTCIPVLQFDKSNNLWLVQSQNATTPVMVLPYAKLGQENLTAADWSTPTVAGLNVQKKMHFMITKKNDYKIFTNGEYSSVIVIFDDNSTPQISSDDRTKIFSAFIDQDEKSYELNTVNCFVEDKNGKVWIGSGNGVIEINPANAFSDNFRINHIKVPRNDGTSYADYLLENNNVTAIAVDGANRKWIGTQNAGLFLVSADGSEILKTFNTSNSYLLDNNITSLACNPNNNSVYIGTAYGTVEYSSDAAPSEADFNNVYAYPNPVRPEYTGLITVRGLMDNSLVKFTDASGNVVYSTRSTGGMVTWDGNNINGERVKTGVYYVLASQNESESSSGAVTKILIVR
ncbi:MAG: two-component regulator propeller domain-containing protein [Muribaculaceae bacterium]|nr:two-component regulator propeller domain-containing protein [Muribaculaceae bacterium]